MNDTTKTKDELLDELDTLRRHISALEAELPTTRVRALRMEREPCDALVEFIAEFGAIEATAIDLSTGGVCIDVPVRPEFRLTIETDGEVQKLHARLAWARDRADGGCRLGFEFIREDG